MIPPAASSVLLDVGGRQGAQLLPLLGIATCSDLHLKPGRPAFQPILGQE